MNNEDFVTYEQAVKLKELGFDWKCNHSYYGRRSKGLIEFCTYYDFNKNGGPNECSAPTLSQAQKWLREVKGIHIEIKYTFNPQYEPWIGKLVIIGDQPEPNTIINTDTCDSYEEALLEGIGRALELLTKWK